MLCSRIKIIGLFWGKLESVSIDIPTNGEAVDKWHGMSVSLMLYQPIMLQSKTLLPNSAMQVWNNSSILICKWCVLNYVMWTCMYYHNQYFTYLKISCIRNRVGPNHFGYEKMHCSSVGTRQLKLWTGYQKYDIGGKGHSCQCAVALIWTPHLWPDYRGVRFSGVIATV